MCYFINKTKLRFVSYSNVVCCPISDAWRQTLGLFLSLEPGHHKEAEVPWLMGAITAKGICCSIIEEGLGTSISAKRAHP